MNTLSRVMEHTYKMLSNVDAQFKKMGKEPYGVRKATPAEQRRMYENLTPEELWKLINTEGLDETNKFLAKFEEQGNGRPLQL